MLHSHSRLSLIKTALLLLVSVTSVCAQRLWIESAGLSQTWALGDTVDASIYIDTQGRSLTSVGLALSYDPRRLDVLNTSTHNVVEPFDLSPGLSGGIFTNDVSHASTQDARARFVFVTSQQSGSRQVILGRHRLAHVRWRVVGVAASTQISLVGGGPDGPVFTEIGIPGRAHGFLLSTAALSLQLSAAGFVPIGNVAIDSHQPWQQQLDRIHPYEHLTWHIDHNAGDLLHAQIVDDALHLRARPRVAGVGQVEYSAFDGEDEFLRGQFAVTVSPVSPMLALAPIAMDEDVRYQVTDPFLSTPPAGHQLQIEAGKGLVVQSESDGWSVSGEADWSGISFLTLRLLDSQLSLIDSVQVPVTVREVDDAPVLQREFESPLQAVQGADSWGPTLSELFDDADDDVTQMAFAASGDGIVSATIDQGRLRLHGLLVGRGTIELTLDDPTRAGDSGAHIQWSLPVDVQAQVEAPRFHPWNALMMTLEESVVRSWEQILVGGTDANLVISAQSSTHLVAQVHDDGLHITALSPGDGWISLQVRDPQGNASSAVLSVQIDAVAQSQDPVTDKPATTPDPASDAIGSSGTELGNVSDVVTPGPPQGAQEEGTTLDPISSDDPQTSDAVRAPQISLELPSQVRLTAGTTTDIDLPSALRGAAGAQVLWGATDGALVHVQVDEAGRLLLEAPETASGSDEVFIHVYLDQERVTVPLRVYVDVYVDVSATSLQIREIPSVRLPQGGSLQLTLADYLGQADGPVQWQVTPGQIVTASIQDSLLTIYAGLGRVGEEALVLTVSDGLQQAERLVQVVVESDQAAPLQIEMPTAVTLGPGETQDLDPESWVLAGQVDEWSLLQAPVNGSLSFESGLIRLHASHQATAGYLDFHLEASSGGTWVGVTLRAVVVVPPALRLQVPATQNLVAGQRQALLHLPSLVLETDGPVTWTIVEARRVTAIIDDEWLVVDAQHALPGRRVLQLQASTAARSEFVDLIVRIEAPQVSTSTWQVELTQGVGARLSLDGLVASSFDSLAWRVDDVGAGIETAWDATAGTLTVIAEESGSMTLEARLPSGLLVATSLLQVLLLEENDNPTEAESSPDVSVVAAWELATPVIDTPWQGQGLTIPLSSLLVTSSAPAGSLVWEARLLAGDGSARIDRDALHISANSRVTVWIRATDTTGIMHSMVLPVQIRELPAPRLEVSLAGSGLDLFVEISQPARGRLLLNEEEVEIDQHGYAHVPLGPGKHTISVSAIAESYGVQKIAQQQVAVFISDLTGGRVALSSGAAAVEIPVGSDGGVMLQQDPDGVLMILSETLRTSGVGLLLADPTGNREGPAQRPADLASAGVEWLGPAGWELVPSWRVTAPPVTSGHQDVYGHYDVYAPVFANGVYRRVETEGLSRTLKPVNAYPNPFNAETTLQFVTSSRDAVVDLTLYDALGQRVRYWQIHHPGGGGTVRWDGLDMHGRPVATGVYLLRMQTPIEQVVHKLLLLR